MSNDTSTLNGALQELGETMASNLESMGIIDAQASDGLTTLANRILDIEPTIGGLDLDTVLTLTSSDTSITLGSSIVLTSKLSAFYDDETVVDVDLQGVLQNATVKFMVGSTVVGTGVTDTNGVATATITPTTIGTMSYKAVFEGTENFKNCESSTVNVTVIAPSYDKITLTSDKSILSHYDSDSATLTAQLMNGTSTAEVAGVSIDFYQDDSLLGSVVTGSDGSATYTYTSQGIGDTTFEARVVGTSFSETYEVRDVHYYNDCTTNSVEDYFTVPYAVSSRSIYGFNSDGWKFGNCTSYQRIIGKEKLSDWFAVEFTVTEINGSGGLIQYIYSNGTTPNAGVLYDAFSTNKWTIGDTNLTHSFSIGTTVKIEWRSGTVKVYLNDELLGSGNHSVSLPTQVEFHTGTNRYVRIKDLIIETL